jgi:hypothetical protein
MIVTALEYRRRRSEAKFSPELGSSLKALDVHCMHIPEMQFPIEAEVERLAKIIDHCHYVNLFLSKRAGVDRIIKEIEASDKEGVRDACGYNKLDTINPGQWSASKCDHKMSAEEKFMQKEWLFCAFGQSESDYHTNYP